MKDLIYDIDNLLVYLKDTGFSVSIMELKTENNMIRVSIRKRNFNLKEIWDDVLTVNDLLKSRYKGLKKRYIADNVECSTYKLERNMAVESAKCDIRTVFVIYYKLTPDPELIELKLTPPSSMLLKNRNRYIESYEVFESKSSIKFIKKEKKKGAKTDTYEVSKSGTVIGQIKWSSRMRGYAFLPTSECDSEVKEFVKDLMRKRREDK
jgi:hypothetical protein